MDLLKLEDRINRMETNITIAMAMSGTALEKLDELRNKLKFAMEQEMVSDDEDISTTRMRKSIPVEEILAIIKEKQNMNSKEDLSDDEKDDQSRRVSPTNNVHRRWKDSKPRGIEKERHLIRSASYGRTSSGEQRSDSPCVEFASLNVKRSW